MTEGKKDVLRETTSEAVRLAKTLLRTARSGTIATLGPDNGAPIATRVGVSTDTDGTPTILVSALAAHTRALRADSRCSLLLGEPGKGDPLAHPRITLACTAREIPSGAREHARVSGRYLAHSPKAGLYAGLPDFSFFRLEIASASLNAGFGKAYALTRENLLSLCPDNEAIASAEPGAVEHMNEDHAVAVANYARHYCRAPGGNWVLLGIDAEGVDLANGDDVRRIFFDRPLQSAEEMRPELVRMAVEARKALASDPGAVP